MRETSSPRRLRLDGSMRRVPLLGVLPALAASLMCGGMTVHPQPEAPPPEHEALAPAVWTASAMERVFRRDPPRPLRGATLFAARGEYEAFQIVVHAPGGALTGVEVSASDLVAPTGQSLPAATFSVFREQYVDVPRSSHAPTRGNHPEPPGAYPDALVPMAAAGTPRLGVPAGENQPFWIDVRVPRGVAPGLHTGTVTVTTDQGRVSVPVSLTIWDFDLPAVPSLRSSFGLTGPRLRDEAYQRLLLEHKVMPTHVSAAAARTLRARGLNVAGLEYWSDQDGCAMKPPPSGDALRKAVAAYPSGLDLYVYVADEPLAKCDDPARITPKIAAWARSAHAARAKALVTIPPRPELLDDGTGRSSVDVWVMLPNQLDAADPAQVEARRHGDELWWYTALAQDAYSPKWLLDYAPINYRIGTGFIAQSLGLAGVLYWAVDHWSGDPWADVYYREGSASWAGEGLLVYPGEPAGADGPVPSMRLKWIREGVEDFEYVELLKRRGRGAFALEVARSVGADWRSWTKDPGALEQARMRLGQELDRLGTRPDGARIEPTSVRAVDAPPERATRKDTSGTARRVRGQ
ncbi:DUF4091 domain-containing protein [Anaeromyxobacter oryzae]|uniref:Glycoside hydrolase 123 C-terminal domain-containing protein n=1 Tax=Anaeromyxobacter oryzae TaxID=2918170 RepID=A0ABM7X3F2_9BACT|nr:glycoside hydrolase domain-containing protein [Anaeromyxobacter oryzae]BDG06323.1 hypothetical protein AMOR_53190 [Anaeromyxobacter oryzae]